MARTPPKVHIGGRRGRVVYIPVAYRDDPQSYLNGQQNNSGLNISYQGQTQSDPYGTGLKGVYSPGYTDDDNPALLKWQGQEDDKAARYLSKVNKDVQLNQGQYQDQYGFYESESQKFVLAMGLNKKPLVLDDAEFDRVVKQNNLQVLYRGETSQTAADRFMNADLYHVGAGYYGDGIYFFDSSGKYSAEQYALMKGGDAGRVERMALSPQARVITHSELTAKMQGHGKLTKALSYAGNNTTSPYPNDGEMQYALKLGYNVITIHGGKNVALTRDALIVSRSTYKP